MMSKTGCLICVFMAGLIAFGGGLAILIETLVVGETVFPSRHLKHSVDMWNPLFYLALAFWIGFTVVGLILMHFVRLTWRYRNN